MINNRGLFTTLRAIVHYGWWTGVASGLLASMALAEPTRVKTAPLSELEVPIVYSAPATVVSLNQTRISAELDARIIEIGALQGDVVAAGETLVRLDCRDYKLSLQRAKGDLAALLARQKLAQQQRERAESLARSKNISQDLLDQRRTEVEAAAAEVASQRAAVDSAETQVTRCEIKSPFRAAVTEKFASVGEFARVGTALLLIEDLGAVEVSAQIIPIEVPSLQRTTYLAFVFNRQHFPAVLGKVSPVIDATTRTREARLTFADTRPPIGAAGRVHWTDARSGLRADLLVQRGDELGVFIAREDQAIFVPIPGALEGRPTPTDLPRTAAVITEGRQALRNGDPILVVD